MTIHPPSAETQLQTLAVLNWYCLRIFQLSTSTWQADFQLHPTPIRASGSGPSLTSALTNLLTNILSGWTHDSSLTYLPTSIPIPSPDTSLALTNLRAKLLPPPTLTRRL